MSDDMEMHLTKISDRLEILIRYKYMRVECTAIKKRGTILSYLTVADKPYAIVLFDDTLELDTVPIKKIRILAPTEQYV